MTAWAAVVVGALVAGILVGSPPAQAATRRPVIVVAGLGGAAGDYATIADRLDADGFTVEVFELPDRGHGEIHASAQALAERVDLMLARTGSDQVDLVGHSLGGLVSRDYVRFGGGAAKVDKVVTVGTPNQGTFAANLWLVLTWGTCLGSPSCRQMAIGSSYLEGLNAGDHAVGDVRYWTFATQYDEFAYPYRNSFLRSSTDRVVNVVVQDQCWGRTLGHVALMSDPTVYGGIVQALDGRPFIWLNCWTPIVGAL